MSYAQDIEMFVGLHVEPVITVQYEPRLECDDKY